MHKLHTQHCWQSSLKASVVSFLLLALSGCQFLGIASYRWHIADAEAI
jgi:hypothetical protein